MDVVVDATIFPCKVGVFCNKYYPTILFKTEGEGNASLFFESISDRLLFDDLFILSLHLFKSYKKSLFV